MRSHKKQLLKIHEHAMDSFQYNEGIVKFEKVSRTWQKPLDEVLLCKLGTLYDHRAFQQKTSRGRKNDEAMALELYRRALRLNPKSHFATWCIGRVYWHRGDKKAIYYAKKAYLLCKKNKGEEGLYAQHIGLIYGLLGESKKAEYWLLRGLKEGGRGHGAYMNLVLFYEKEGRTAIAAKYTEQLRQLYIKKSPQFKKTRFGRYIKQIIQRVTPSAHVE